MSDREGGGGAELEAFPLQSTAMAASVRNKLEQDGRIFPALRMEEFPVAAGQTAANKKTAERRSLINVGKLQGKKREGEAELQS